MLDPIGAFEQIRDNLILYIKTAFGTRYPSLEIEREHLMRTPGVLCQEPWIEPLPRYRSSGKTIAALDGNDLPSLTPREQEGFKEFVRCGLFPDESRTLHHHQTEMLHQALSERHCVVTAGTGSGKTEAFLLPIFAYLIRESESWAPAGISDPREHDWWKNEAWQISCLNGRRMQRSYRVPQRAHEQRPKAVRALVLYPMNALVEDQLTRLRKALDSASAREWLSRNRNGNRFYFGRYNSSTPVAGHELKAPSGSGARTYDRPRIERLKKALAKMDQAAQAAAHAAGETDQEDLRYFFPRVDGAEMLSRWDMQDAPPDILISNFSMLSVMLMREADEAIFDKTREWLAGGADRIFHLVVDELHLYRGTSGAEVAYLLRLLLLRLGLTPDHPQLRILASSASLEPNKPDSRQFLRDFFGSDPASFDVIPGTRAPAGTIQGSAVLPAGPFQVLADAAPDLPEPVCRQVAQALGFNGTLADGRAALQEILESPVWAMETRMLRACMEDNEIRAVSLTTFADALFGTEINKQTRQKAARGLLAARGLCDAIRAGSSSLPSFRLHVFFRNVEGLWASVKPPADSEDDRPVGRLYERPRIISDGDESCRVLEVLYCEHCGAVFLGGNRLEPGDSPGEIELLASDPDIEGIPDRKTARLVEKRTYREFAVFWPAITLSVHSDASTHWNQPVVSNDDIRPATARWVAASLHTRTGRVKLSHDKHQEDPVNWVKGFLYVIDETRRPDWDSFGALPSICACCAADHTRRRRRSPVRGFRTGFSKVSQVLTKELFYRLPESTGRKIVVFSDSREDAAQISNGVERNHYFDLLREAVVDELRLLTIGEAQLLEDIRNSTRPFRAYARRFLEIHPDAETKIQNALQTLAGEPPSNPDYRTVYENVRQYVEAVTQRGLSRNVHVETLLPPASNPGDCGPLVRRLINIGVNPAGNDLLYQEFGWDRQYHFWTNLFDFQALRWSDTLPQAADRAKGMLYDKLVEGLCDLFYSRLYFSLESSGLGYLRLRILDGDLQTYALQAGLPPENFRRVCDSAIRVLGDLYRHEGSDFGPPESWPSSASRAPSRASQPSPRAPRCRAPSS